MFRFVTGLLLLQVVWATTYYKETFDSKWTDRWTQSKAKSDYGEFVLSAGKFYGDAGKDQGIQTSKDAKFYAISSKIPQPFSNKDNSLVVQFSVKHEQDIDCGGGYIKVTPAVDPEKFDGESPYYIMFGPDVCGATKKIHLIFNYKGKNLLWKKEPRCETDTFTHVYTVVVNADNTYEVYVDQEKKESGKLEDDWDFLKPKTIPDPEDKKPSDWADEAEVPDPEDKKPDDWDAEPSHIPDPDAAQPDDWDEEEDGKWEPPTISNPKFKGAWKAKMIPNPAYKGVWKPKEIANPEYEADNKLYLYNDIASVGFDLWQVKSGTIFDNIIITDSLAEAKAFYAETSGSTKEGEKKMHDKLEEEKKAREEEERKKREAEEKKTADEEGEDDEDDEEGKKEPQDEL